MTNSLLFALWARDKDNGKYRALSLSDSLRFVLWARNKSGGGTLVDVSGTAPLEIPDALAKAITTLKQYGKAEQNGTPTPLSPVDIKCNNGTLMWKDRELPVGYTRIQRITFGGSTYYETNEKLYGSDIVTLTIDDFVQSGQNLFGCYSGTGDDVYNFSMYVYGSATGQAYWRYGQKLYRPTVGSTALHTLTFGAGGTAGFKTNVSYNEVEFETTDTARIGALPNSSSPKYSGDIVGTITVGNRLRYIPCIRQSDGVIGYYELMNQVFLEPQGSTPVAGDADLTHMALEVVGTSEEISISASDATTQTASAVDLFGVGQYRDIQNIITGEVIRNLGVYVLDGVTNRATNSNLVDNQRRFSPFTNFNGNSSTLEVKCLATHYQNISSSSATYKARVIQGGLQIYDDRFDNESSPLDAFNAWLAEQYAAGDPVIVLYPLAEATTEQTTPQHLSTSAGDNTLDVTAEVSGITFDVTYTTERTQLS